MSMFLVDDDAGLQHRLQVLVNTALTVDSLPSIHASSAPSGNSSMPADFTLLMQR